KASDVRDTSLKLPPGNKGTVVGVNVFSRRGIDKDERALAIEKDQIDSLAKDRDDERKILERSFRGRLFEMIEGQQIVEAPEKQLINTRVDVIALDDMPTAQLRKIVVADDEINNALEGLRQQFDSSIGAIQARFDDKVDNVQAGDELAPGVMKMIKIFVAIKRKLQPGDKMAGRHGNKGVISRIIPREDMPYLDDGTPVDVVLNPLGVPSRMNVGQILETHLGWACAELGRQIGEAVDIFRENHDMKALRGFMEHVYDDKNISRQIEALSDGEVVELGENLRQGVPIQTPVFDGAREEDINTMLKRAGLHKSGQVWLTDGRTGERFERPVTVGYIYMLKLHHMVDDKIHSRSVGPYSLVTQQPLGGKAQFGGQRFGEMEVWALEAYGAAYTLQEMLTIKSDDVSGRTKVYESIVRGDDNFESGVPESFNVLVKELRSLGLNVEMLQGE
ncbi:MAG: DNA-directed RNA polymerase subunit beta, partial [Pseudomonadota bacterium]